ncbi:MAG: NADH-quinone oxidoreductase subunit I [bacterium]
MGIVKDIKNLLAGLGITSKHLGRHAITIQYPEQKMEMFERSRGIVVLLSDKETGELNCTACALCEKACPTRAIKIEWHRDENKRKILDSFTVDNTLCCFCGLCEEACNFCAIKMANKYEFSVLDKAELIWDVKRLQEIGRDVAYEDTRKKKKEKPEATTGDKLTEAKAEAKPKVAVSPDSEKKQPDEQPKGSDEGAS